MNTATSTGLLAVALWSVSLLAQPATNPQVQVQSAATAKEPAGDDPTRPYRRPGELIARCGAITVKDLGLWPDMNAAFQGKGPEFISRPLGGAINSRGEVFVVLDQIPADGVTRDRERGTVQYVVRGRPSSGVINEHGDVFGQLIVANPPGSAQPMRQENFMLRAPGAGRPEAGADSPEIIKVPEGQYLMPWQLGSDGVGIARLTKAHPAKRQKDDGAPATTPVLVERDPTTGAYTLKPIIAPEKIPKGLVSFYPVARNARGEVAVNMTTPTGERLPMKMRGDDGVWVETCPAFIVSLIQSGIVRNGELEVIPVPNGFQEASAVALTDDGALILQTTRHAGKITFSSAGVWKNGVFKSFRTFSAVGRTQPTDADGPFACGVMTLSNAVLGDLPRKQDPALQEATDQLRTSAALWDLATGHMLTLDSLLPEAAPCTHITTAAAMRGDKVLCTGLIDGRIHGLVVTLPARVAEGFTPIK